MAIETEIRPGTPERWPDMVRLFTGKGCPHYCWCMPYRAEDPAMDKSKRRAAMEELVAGGTPVGLLAYDGEEPVAWVSASPRQDYPKLARSQVMPPRDDGQAWTVTCFFVRRDHRGQGLTRTLLEAAVDQARRRGADVVEGYPFDTAGITATHMGHSSVFAACNFQREGETRRWKRDLGS